MANSTITRRAIANAFKQLLATTPFDRVTVTAVASQCGINRQTFYYHFRDIYDLMSWIVEDRVRSVLGYSNMDLPENTEVIVEACLVALKEEQDFVTRLLHSLDPVAVNHILQAHLGKVIEKSLEKIYEQSKLTEDNKRIITSFVVGGFLNVLYTWANDGMREDPSLLAHRVATIVCSSLRVVIPQLS
jgi:probable dihydroxyacetone kinase regulator